MHVFEAGCVCCGRLFDEGVVSRCRAHVQLLLACSEVTDKRLSLGQAVDSLVNAVRFAFVPSILCLDKLGVGCSLVHCSDGFDLCQFQSIARVCSRSVFIAFSNGDEFLAIQHSLLVPNVA